MNRGQRGVSSRKTLTDSVRAGLACALAIAGLLSGLWAASAHAQQRPLTTEDPESVGAGVVLIEGGAEFLREQVYTVSGLHGNLVRVPVVGVSVGISSIAEVQLDGSLWNQLQVTKRRAGPLADMLDFTGNRTSSADDFVVATKIRMLSEGQSRPALGIRLATKLPNASNESGLGLDTTDFFATLLLGKTIQSVRVVGNIGFGILGDPTRGDRQNDVLTYGASVARAIRQGLEVVGEVSGRLDLTEGDPPPGTENHSMMRLGTRYTRGSGRIDAAVLVGMTVRDPSVGLAIGYTHVFRAFRVP